MNSTKQESEFNVDTWKWCPDSLTWLHRDSESSLWVEDHPPLPEWFIEAQGRLSAAKFIPIWQQAETLNDVKKVLHWLSIEEIEAWYQTINADLISRSIQPLRTLLLHQPQSLSEEEVRVLVEQGILTKESFAPKDPDVYDPMQALFEAQSRQSSSEQPHIQTMEVGDKYRFRAKH